MTSSSGHTDFGPELRQLAQAVLDRLDPAVRSAAAMAADAMRGPGRCEQVWCPVCALAALVNGEQHPMLALIAEHSDTLMTVLRTMTADPQAPPAPGESAAPEDESGAGESPKLNGNGRYQHIPIVVEPAVVESGSEN